ncbi:hypothetical protein K438DRAFT_1991482 [Mycena galopus ATCC 62051]|nr:hypothetical protein K438DRAFT_1991482 [Mycena galopus ATCC 62051]
MAPAATSWVRRGSKSKNETRKGSWDAEKQVTLSAAMYAIEGGKTLAEALESVSDLVPLPFLTSFLNVGIKEATAIEENVKELQGRVYNLMLVVVDTVPINQETSLELQDRIKKLQLVLDSLLKDVAKIKEQKEMVAPLEQFSVCLPHSSGIGTDLLQVASQLRVEDLTSRACITGVGGMGKTSVALAVAEAAMKMNMFPKEFIFWVPCVEAKSPDLPRHILFARLRITAKTRDSLDPLSIPLSSSAGWPSSTIPRLMAVGDRPGRSREYPREASGLAADRPPRHYDLWLHSWTPSLDWQHRALPALDPAAARDAFKERYRDAAGGLELAGAEPELDSVLTAIGHIPLGITLMAPRGGHRGLRRLLCSGSGETQGRE